MNIADEDIDGMIARAVAAERERCAKIAESAINNMNGQAKAGMARAISRRIRNPEQLD